ncbi:MAG: peptidoglycan editing factor PgeF [Proteobacteria bacterium]|nr:peptidoglycan editing factor PgeF [Pseudomonadota bacterium]
MDRSDKPSVRGCITLELREAERRRFIASRLRVDWPAPPNVLAFGTLRGPAGDSQPPFQHLNLGVRCGDDLATAMANRADLSFYMELPSPPHWLHQVHGKTVVRFDKPAPQVPYREWDRESHERLVACEPQADAAVTCVPGVVLAILTADCMPVLFCAGDGSGIAAAHAGWRGLCAGVLENTLDALAVPREKILAWLGPAIGPRSYEVGEEVRDAFLVHAADAASAFAPTRPGHWHCDLYALARQRLHAAGVARISGGDFDTFTDPRFHSYRRDGARSGRFATLAWLDAGSTATLAPTA